MDEYKIIFYFKSKVHLKAKIRGRIQNWTLPFCVSLFLCSKSAGMIKQDMTAVASAYPAEKKLGFETAGSWLPSSDQLHIQHGLTSSSCFETGSWSFQADHSWILHQGYLWRKRSSTYFDMNIDQ